MAEACEVEESSLCQGEQLTQEDQEGNGGEDYREDHEGLYRLQPVWERRRSEKDSLLNSKAGVKKKSSRTEL